MIICKITTMFFKEDLGNQLFLTSFKVNALLIEEMPEHPVIKNKLMVKSTEQNICSSKQL